MKPLYFKSQVELRKWFKSESKTSEELWVVFYRKGSEEKSVSYPEAVDEALCFGWIDGIRKKLTDTTYMNRFTPRRSKSNWSDINKGHAKRLIKEGKMTPAGLAEIERAKDDGRWNK